jgi:rubrerythrin
MSFDRVQDVIEFAIGKEQEAVELYTDLAGSVESPEMAEELRRIAAIEMQHKKWLQDTPVALAASGESDKAADLKIADYVVEAQPGPDMSFEDIINIAMHREMASVKLYTSLAKTIADPTIKQIFENLAAQETAHKRYFESIWDDRVLTED